MRGDRADESVDVAVLGPVGVIRDGELVQPSSGIVRALLGTLALQGSHGMAAGVLAEVVWRGRAGGVPESTLGVGVHRLRQWLHGVAGEAVSVIRTTDGYALRLTRGEVDAARFRRLSTEGSRKRMPERLARLEEALALWRGRPLEDVAPERTDRTAVEQVERERVTVTVEHARAALAAGNPERALVRLGRLVDRHRLDERLLSTWIEVLTCCGRQAEALEAYERTRNRLREQLGVDPGPELREAHTKVLRQETATGHGPVKRAPHPDQVPAATADFTGRAEQVKVMLGLLSVDHHALVVSAVAGMGGIGKTTLAVHVAHRLRERFPGGQLYVDLRGAELEPTEPGEVLGRFLRAMGVAATAIPEELAERAALYRSLLADRRMLVLLDNASDEEQVAPLLPGSDTCRVIVTSRSRLTALPGVRLIELDVLELPPAVDLLTRIIGADRASAERDAVEELASMCGGLPLALRVAGARLAAKPHWRIAELVTRLRERRLDELTHKRLSVRAALDFSYDDLDPTARRLYRLLGMLDAPDVAGWVPAALLDVPCSSAAEVIEQLIDAQLLDAAVHEPGGEVRYRFHDLVREHARDRCVAEDAPAERRAAALRALGGWLALTDRVVRSVNGGGNTVTVGGASRYRVDEKTVESVLAGRADWLERERLALIAAVVQAARLSEDELCWELAIGASVLFQPTHYLDAWQQVIDAALPAVRTSGNRRGEGAVLHRLAELASARRDYGHALKVLRRALPLFEAIEDARGLGLALRQRAVIHRMTGRFAESLSDGERACALLRKVGDSAGRAHALMVMGCVLYERGDAAKALAVLTDARDVANSAEYTNIAVQSTYWIGQALLDLGRHQEAMDLFEYVDRASTAAGSRLGGMYASHGLGCTYAALGRHGEAEQFLHVTLRLAEERGDRLMRARVLYLFGDLHRRHGEHQHARRRVQQALDLAEEVSVPLWTARCLALLADIADATGRHDAARPLRDRALTIFAELGVSVPQGPDRHEGTGRPR
jgi:DNA-binding SARP family transcriptional activator